MLTLDRYLLLTRLVVLHRGHSWLVRVASAASLIATSSTATADVSTTREADRTAFVAANPGDAEAALAQTEMHASAGDWQLAERTVRSFLATTPGHRRGLELLAWILEGQGRLDSELELRAMLAAGSDQAEPVRNYGRALERSGDWAGALVAYRRAARLSGGSIDHSLSRELERMDRRMSLEVAAGVAAKSDPGAASFAGFTGVALPFGRAHQVTIGAWHERASKDEREGSGSELSAAVSFRGRTTQAFAGAKLGVIETTMDPGPARMLPGGFGSVRTKLLDGHVQLGVDGELGSVWRETPRAVLEGGSVDSVTTHVWGVLASNRLVIDTGVQLRRLQLDDRMGGEPSAAQALMWTGADFALWTNFSREAAGETLDDDLLRPTYLADSLVLGYRHYELRASSNAAFDARMSMADRASIDEVSVVARKALLRGRVAFEARAGAGRDWLRDLYLARGGLSLWLASSSRARFSLSLDLAKESTRALTGERRAGWMTYHVDL